MLLKRQDIAIDLGTSTVLIYIKGRGIVLREPSVVAVNNETNEVEGVGLEAQRMLGRAPETISVVRPLKDGVISDCDITQQMLELFMRKALPHRGLLKPHIIMCVPSGVTDVERRSVLGAAQRLGTRHAFIMEEPRAAALGAGLNITRPHGTLVVDIGGGTTDVALLSLGNTVVSHSVKVAGNQLDEDIVKYMRQKHNLLIGERTAEMLKIEIGSAWPRSETLTRPVMGRNLLTGLPKTVEVSSEEVHQAMQDSLDQICTAIHTVLEQAPPELASDVIEGGIVLTGGGALLMGMDKLIASQFGINCYVAEDAVSCVALGAGKMLFHLDALSEEEDPDLWSAD